MHLTRFTDYSLKVLIYLGLRGDDWTTIQDVSEAYDISRNHLMKVASFLTAQGYLESQRGPGGGIRLRQAPDSIIIAQVVKATETRLCLIEVMHGPSETVMEPVCRMEAMFNEALQAFLESLGQYCLQDLLEPRPPFKKRPGLSVSA